MTTNITDYSKILERLESCRCKGGVHLEECTNEYSETSKVNCKCKLCLNEMNFLDMTKEKMPCCEKSYIFIFQEEIVTHVNSKKFSVNLYSVDECMSKVTSQKRVDCIVFVFSKNSTNKHPHIILIEDKCTAPDVSGIIKKKGISYLSKRIITQEITKGKGQGYQETLCELITGYNSLNLAVDEKEKLTKEEIENLVSHLKPLVQLRGTIKWLKALFSEEGMKLEERKITPLLLIGGKKFYESNYEQASDCEILAQYKDLVREYKDHPAKELCKQSDKKVGFEDRGGFWKEVIEGRDDGAYSHLIERITEDVRC